MRAGDKKRGARTADVRVVIVLLSGLDRGWLGMALIGKADT
jgi:hypothetical protein